MVKFKCRLCGKQCHDLSSHVEKEHDGMTTEKYLATTNHYIRKLHGGRIVSKWYLRNIEKISEKNEVNDFAQIKKEPIKNHFQNLLKPSLFLPDKKHKDQLLKCILNGDNCLMVGPTGCGKTTLATLLAKENNINLYHTKFNTEMTVSDLLGHPIITEDKKIGFAYGILPRAMNSKACGNGDEEHWLLIDEIDAAPARVLFALFGALEDQREIFVMEACKTIKATPNFRIIATANTKGIDEDGRYVRQVFDEAFLDRWSLFECNYTEHEKTLLIKKEGIPEETAEKMMKFLALIRKGVENEEIRMSISTRRLLDWANKIKIFNSTRVATKLSLLNRLCKEDQAIYKSLFQRIFAREIK